MVLFTNFEAKSCILKCNPYQFIQVFITFKRYEDVGLFLPVVDVNNVRYARFCIVKFFLLFMVMSC